jgi:cellulose synthase/poly-beta-1,6-N-acetylglucosamine synthase-like glycosyltransferase
MLTFFSILLAALAVLLTIPAAVLLLEVVASVVLPKRECPVLPDSLGRPRVAVLVPAHNEGGGLLPTLADIRAQMRGSDRLVVVADNCTDDTAAIAAAAGADVVDRNDPSRRGKGYALAAGLRHLAGDPPDIVVMVDADCRLADSAVDRMAVACAASQRPVQAWRVKNSVRPLGLRALGLPCQLMGSGMAFPWEVIRSVDLASGSIVEDLKLGLDLAVAGYPPLFCPFPGVTSQFPVSVEGRRSQRLRWEQGHIGTIMAAAPLLIFGGLARARLDLLAMGFDLAVPPLALLSVLLVGMTAISGAMILFGCSSTAFLVSSTSLVGFAGAVLLSWFKYGRDLLPPKEALSIASYVIDKLPAYWKILSGRSVSRWIRTDRSKS